MTNVRKLYVVNRVYDEILVSLPESVLPSYLAVQPFLILMPNATGATGNNSCSYRLMKSFREVHSALFLIRGSPSDAALMLELVELRLKTVGRSGHYIKR